MKKLILAILLSIFLVVAPASAAVYYVDFANGDDTTGDGSAGTPWKTVDKCTTSGATTGGDECRVAKTTVTALSGTLTFTNGSTSISTSTDLTGELSAGDIVGKNSGNEGWWEVSGVTADTITLVAEYWGTSETTTGYTPTMFVLTDSTFMDINAGGSSSSSLLKISGGWDLTGPTQDGITYVDASDNYIFPHTSFAYREYVEISDFVVYISNQLNPHSYAYYLTSSVWRDIHFVTPYSFTPGDYCSIYGLIVTGGGTSTTAITISHSGRGIYIEGSYFYSQGDTLNEKSWIINNSLVYAKDIYIYNSYDDAISVSTGGCLIGDNINIDTTNYSTSSHGIYVEYNGCIYIKDLSIANTTGNGVSFASVISSGNVLVNPTFSSIGTGNNIYSYSSNSWAQGAVISVKDYNGTSNDDRMWWNTDVLSQAGIAEIFRDTTDARSGSCLKFTANNDDGPINYKVGTYKITDASRSLILSAYIKDDVSFDGKVKLMATVDNGPIGIWTIVTPTTSYVKHSVTIPTTELTVGAWADLWIIVSSANGSVFVDDFEVAQ